MNSLAPQPFVYSVEQYNALKNDMSRYVAYASIGGIVGGLVLGFIVAKAVK